MKPIYEPEQTDPPIRSQPQTGSHWGVRLGILALFCAVAVVGFGSSMGWFDGLFGGAANARKQAAFQDAGGHNATRESSDDTSDGALADSGSTAGSNPAGASSATSASGSGEHRRFTAPPLSPIMPQSTQELMAEARRVVEHMVQEMPDVVEAKEILARFEFDFGDFDRAEQLWREILEQDPSFVYAMRGLGDIATEQGRLQEGIKYYRMAVLADPQNLSRQVTLGVALMNAGELEAARDVLQAVVRKKPDYVEAIVELGAVLLQLEQWEAAREYFGRALELAPEQPEIHFGLMKAYTRLGQREKAREHMELHKKYQAQLTEMREQGRRTYDDEEAMRIDVARVYVDMARVYLAHNDAKTAELLLVRASRLDPQNIDARQALAWRAKNEGRLLDAVRWLSEISRTRPDEFHYVREIARLLVDARQSDRAERILLDFLKSHPDHVEALQTAVDFYLTVAVDPQKALQYADTLTQVNPTAMAYVYKAAVHQAAGQLREAIEAYEKAAELDSGNVAYRETAALLREELAASAAAGADQVDSDRGANSDQSSKQIDSDDGEPSRSDNTSSASESAKPTVEPTKPPLAPSTTDASEKGNHF